MGWKQEMQYRNQFSLDGGSDMAWQPTLVYQTDAAKRDDAPASGSTRDATDILFMLATFAITTVVYQFVSHINFVEHLSNLLRRILLGGTIVSSFLGTSALLDTKIIRTLIKVGMLVFCARYFFLSAVLHFFK